MHWLVSVIHTRTQTHTNKGYLLSGVIFYQAHESEKKKKKERDTCSRQTWEAASLILQDFIIRIQCKHGL